MDRCCRDRGRTQPRGRPPAYRPMAEICLAQQVSVSAACSAQIPDGKSSAFQRVCSQCSLPEGFEVDRDNIRRVPKEDLLALQQWGPNAFGAFRDAPMQFGSFKYCLINDSSDLSRARERPHKGHPHDEGMRHLSSSSPDQARPLWGGPRRRRLNMGSRACRKASSDSTCGTKQSSRIHLAAAVRGGPAEQPQLPPHRHLRWKGKDSRWSR